MDVTVRLNLEEIAEEINANVGDMETPETVKQWIEQNDSVLRSILRDGVVEAIAEGYEE